MNAVQTMVDVLMVVLIHLDHIGVHVMPDMHWVVIKLAVMVSIKVLPQLIQLLLLQSRTQKYFYRDRFFFFNQSRYFCMQTVDETRKDFCGVTILLL